MNWSQASPLAWSAIATQWNTAAKANSISVAAEVAGSSTNRVVKSETISMAAAVTQTLGHAHTMPVSVSMAQTAAATTVGGFVFSDSISLAATANLTLSHDATLVNEISFAATANAITNLKYPESITLASEQAIFPGQFYLNSASFAATTGMSISDALLWNPESEVSTTWTAVEYPN